MLPCSQDRGAPRFGALFRSGVFASLLLLASSVFSFVYAQPACAKKSSDRVATVSYVFDGDTLELQDRTRVRLIAVNTPEIGRKGKASEYLAEEARTAVIQRIGSHGRVSLQYGTQRTDKYGRTLAHVFLDDGTNLSAWLLEQGYGSVIAIPPNLWGQQCYLEAEAKARRERKGVWSRWPIASTALPEDTKGFYVLRGKVVRVGKSRKSIWLNLPGNVGVRIARTDLDHFPGFEPDRMKGRVILVRGWVYPYKGDHVMRIRHSSSLQIME